MRYNDRKTLALFPVPDVLVRSTTLEDLNQLVLKQNKDGIKDSNLPQRKIVSFIFAEFKND